MLIMLPHYIPANYLELKLQHAGNIHGWNQLLTEELFEFSLQFANCRYAVNPQRQQQCQLKIIGLHQAAGRLPLINPIHLRGKIKAIPLKIIPFLIKS